MFRFTIRDLLWLTVVVGLSLAWWTTRNELKKASVWKNRAGALEKALAAAEKISELRYNHAQALSEAQAKMGTYADALALDQRVRSPRARALGWSPTLHSVAGNVARLLEEFRTRREAA